MNFWKTPRAWAALAASALALFLLYQLWVWEVERIEVPPGKFLVKVKLWGKDLPDGEVVAPDADHKGIQRDVLPEGRHFLNPFLYGHQEFDILDVPAGKCAVLTHKSGAEIAPERRARGEFLVEKDASGEPAERGIVRTVLLQGKHRLNPYVYDYRLEEMTKVGTNQVGVKTLRWGKDPAELLDRKSQYVVPEGYRGVQEKPMPPGDYYLNPFVEAVVPIDVELRQVEFTDIYFPSRDGFTIQPHVRVAYKVLPGKAPELFVMLCDGGQLPQSDRTPEEQRRNPILQKFILPLIRGWVRIEGSKYDARDYVSQQKDVKDAVNPREELRKILEEKVKPQCQEVGVMIESITVAEIEKTDELNKLADQIFIRETTEATRAKNAELVKQFKSETTQKATEVLSERETLLVKADKDLTVAKTEAARKVEVEKAKLENDLKAALTRREAAKELAKAKITRGKAEAAVIEAENKAEVAGLETAVAGFPTPDHFAQYHVMMKLAPSLSEIFASDNGEFGRVFSGYMSPMPGRNGRQAKDAKK